MDKNITTKSKTGKKALLISVSGILILLLTALILMPCLIMPMFLGQRYEQEQYSPDDFDIEAERITLTTEDNVSIAAWETHVDKPKGTVIILSGIQNPSVTAFFGYAKLLADNDWNSLLIEMRARGESGGEEIGFGMTEWRDVKAGVDYLLEESEIKDLPIVAMGTSMGAGTSIIAAGEIEAIDAVISISAFSSWSDLFVDNMAMFGLPKFIGILDLPFINTYLGVHFGFEALRYSPINGIEKLGIRPILMMHSLGDTQVPYTEFEKLLSKAKEYNVDFTTYIREGDEHFICYDRFFKAPAEDKEFSQTIISFLESNFP